jgi:pimeloyl-ACP methyl ester carboxylesterase
MRLRLLGLLLLVFSTAASAALVQLDMRPGIPATAEYTPGDRGKPALLLIHGFLQTRAFPTIATLATGLQDAGYTVLTPTLTLNIPSRGTSLACEALHRHSLEDDVREIARWVAWLKAQGHSKIVLVGHSFGSLQALSYLSSRPDPAVYGYVGASLVEAQIGDMPRARLISDLETQARANNTPPSPAACRFAGSTPRRLPTFCPTCAGTSRGCWRH